MDVRNLQVRLKQAGRTQTELANHLGLTHGQVSRILSGKNRLRVDVLQKIEAFLAEAERETAVLGVAEPRVAFESAPVRFVTLEEARQAGRAPRLNPEERERWFRELRELGEAGKRLPRITDMTDEELLGYDEMA